MSNGEYIINLLQKYGGDVEKARRAFPKAMRPPTLPTAPGFFTAEEARELGIELPGVGWKLRVAPPVDGQEPKLSYISPTEWELTDFGPSPEDPERWIAQTYISPTGEERFTLEQMQAKWTETEELEEAFGVVFPERDIRELTAYAEAQPEAFLTDIFEIGRTPETEDLLRAAFSATPEEIEEFFVGMPSLGEIPPEGISIPLEAEGEEVEALVKPDLSVWIGDTEVGAINRETGEFEQKELAWWQKVLGVPLKGLNYLFEGLEFYRKMVAGAVFVGIPEIASGIAHPAHPEAGTTIESLTKAFKEDNFWGAIGEFFYPEAQRERIGERKEARYEAPSIEERIADLNIIWDNWQKAIERYEAVEAPAWVIAEEKPKILRWFLGEEGEWTLGVKGLVEVMTELPIWLAAPSAISIRGGLAGTARAGGVLGRTAQATRVALAPLAGFEVATSAGLRYGVGIPIKYVTVTLPKTATKKAFEVALDAGLDRWLVRQGIRGNQANRVVAQFLKVNHAWLYKTAQDNLVKNMAKRRGAEAVAKAAADDVIREAEPLLLTATREASMAAGSEGMAPGMTTALTVIGERVATRGLVIPDAVALARILAETAPKAIELIKTQSLMLQLRDKGYSIEAIEAMTAEEAWANLFKEMPIEVAKKIEEAVPEVKAVELTKPVVFRSLKVTEDLIANIKESYTPERAIKVREDLTKVLSDTYTAVQEGRFSRAEFSKIVEEANMFFRSLNQVEIELESLSKPPEAKIIPKAEIGMPEVALPAKTIPKDLRSVIEDFGRPRATEEVHAELDELMREERKVAIVKRSDFKSEADYSEVIENLRDEEGLFIREDPEFTIIATSQAELNRVGRVIEGVVVKPPTVEPVKLTEAEAEVERLAPEVKKMVDELTDKRAYELITEPRPPVGAKPESMPRGTVRHPKFVKGKEDVKREINQEFYEPFKDSPLGASSAAYLKTGDFAKFIELMPDIGELKLEALSNEVRENIAELELLRGQAETEVDIRRYDKLIKKAKGGEKLTIEDAVSLGIALRTTKGGRLLPAIRKSGFYVTTEFAEYPNFDDVGYVSGNAMDTYSLFEAVDGGKATGAVQRDILYPTHITHLARDQFSDAYKYKVDKLVEQFGLESDKKMRKETWAIIQEITKEEADFKTAQVLRKPEIQNLVSKYDKATQTRLIEFSQGVRALLDELITNQNLARVKRGQGSIAYREKYLAWVAETNIWSKLGLHKRTPADFFPKPPLPDYIKPDAPFNPRAMAREGGMAGYEMEMDVRKLLKDYVDTAAKDIFNTNIIHNAKVHVAALHSMGYPNSAKLIQDRMSQSYAGTLPAIEAGVRGIVPMKGLKAVWFVRRQLTRAVFPLNWMWNVTIQPSSIAFTVARYGTRNTIRGLSYLFDSESKAYARERYSWIIKSKRGGKMAYQDIGTQVSGNLWAEGSLLDKAEHIGNFLTNTIEEKLTGISIIAARHHGGSLGYTGLSLDEYASKGGAKTQSMYNFEDLPGILQSKTVGSVFPFQTFCFQAMNFVREMNIVGVRKVVGKAGAYETISATSAEGKATVARRLKMAIEFLAIIMVINMIVDKATNRKPWRMSSFIPMYSNLVMGMDSGNPWNYPLPVQYVAEFWSGFEAVIKYDNWDKLRKWLIRYHMQGGTQVNRMITGAIAVVHGEVTDTRGKQMFEVKPEEWLKVIAMGPYASEQGRDYIDRLQEKKGKWYEYIGFPLPSRIDINDEIDKSLELLGQTDEEGMPHDFSDVVSDIRDIRQAVGDKRFSLSVSPFIDGFLRAEESRKTFEKLPPKNLDNMDEADIADFIFPEADPDSEEITALWTEFNTLETKEQRREFVADYIKSHSEELKENIVANHFSLLQDMWTLEGKDLKAFLEKHTDLTKNWRSDWRKNSPEDDARLAMWGYGGRIQTQEAFDFILKWCNELGINTEHLSTWLPPEGSEENYFRFQEEMLKRSWNSWEAQLILAKDDNLREALGYDPIETPVRALELKVKHRDATDLEKQYKDKDNPLYIEDAEERQDKLREVLGEEKYQEWVDDTRRIEAIEHNAETYEQLSSLFDFLASSGINKSKYIEGEYICTDFTEDLVTEANEKNLPIGAVTIVFEENPGFTHRIAWVMVNGEKYYIEPQTDKIMTAEEVDEYWSEYGGVKRFANFEYPQNTGELPSTINIPDRWAERGRIIDEFGATSSKALVWLVDNSEVYAWAIENGLLDDRRGELMDRINVLRINANWMEEDDWYDNGIPEKFEHIENKHARDAAIAEARAAYLASDSDYYKARYQRKAYKIEGFPEEHIDTYVEYYTSPELKKPADWKLKYWFEDDWFLIEHSDFYKAMLKLGIWQPRELEKVPTRKVFKLYEEWYYTPHGQARRDFEARHPDLDWWLHIVEGTKLESETKEAEEIEETWEERVGRGIATIRKHVP